MSAESSTRSSHEDLVGHAACNSEEDTKNEDTDNIGDEQAHHLSRGHHIDSNRHTRETTNTEYTATHFLQHAADTHTGTDRDNVLTCALGSEVYHVSNW